MDYIIPAGNSDTRDEASARVSLDSRLRFGLVWDHIAELMFHHLGGWPIQP